MARTRTLTQLIADVRDRADVENSDHVTDAQITRYINQSIAALHALIVEQDEDEYAVDVTISVAAGATLSAIISGGDNPAAAPYKVLAVDVINSNGLSYPVPRYMPGERALLGAVSRSPLETTHYRLRGLNTLYWSPPFASAVSVRVTYVESSVDLVSLSDVYDGRDGWEEWVTLDAAIKVAIKEESDDTQMARERAMVQERVFRQLVVRDRAQPKRIRDVMGGERW